jgi:uncharacterized protein (DUF39 family)
MIERDAEIKNLKTTVNMLEKKEEEYLAKVAKYKLQNTDILARCKQAYKEIQSTKITHEKEKYEMYLKMKEQTHILKQTKRDLKQKDTQLMVI